jgi:hypothetical protein
VTVGNFMPDEWWFSYGRPIKPTVSDVARVFADLAFAMQDVHSFDDYCALKGLDSDSRRAYNRYQSDLLTCANLQTLLGTSYDLFVEAEVDI